MRIRDFIKLPAKVIANLIGSATLVFTPEGEVGFKLTPGAVMNIHQNSIVLSKLIANGFNMRRLFWEDLKHELQFVPQEMRTEACLGSLKEADAALATVIEGTSDSGGYELELVDMLLSLRSSLKWARDEFVKIPDVEKYNTWTREIGGDSGEGMTSHEQLQEYFRVIQQTRMRTYPIWQTLIDLLPAGNVKTEAETKFAQGLKTVEVDSASVESDWEIS